VPQAIRPFFLWESGSSSFRRGWEEKPSFSAHPLCNIGKKTGTPSTLPGAPRLAPSIASIRGNASSLLAIKTGPSRAGLERGSKRKCLTGPSLSSDAPSTGPENDPSIPPERRDPETWLQLIDYTRKRSSVAAAAPQGGQESPAPGPVGPSSETRCAPTGPETQSSNHWAMTDSFPIRTSKFKPRTAGKANRFFPKNSTDRQKPSQLLRAAGQTRIGCAAASNDLQSSAPAANLGMIVILIAN